MTTQTDIASLPASRELDALVAEKVMGWKRGSTVHGYDAWWTNDSWTWAVHGETRDERTEWKPSTSIIAAWKVVEKLSAGHYGQFNLCDTANGWEASWVANQSIAHADTAPLAICRAALQAVGA